jgi:hypothetical protein
MLASVKSNRKRAHQPSDLAVGADVRLEPTFPDRNHGVPELAELSGNAAISTAVSCHFHPPECDVRFGRPPAPRAPVPKAPMNEYRYFFLSKGKVRPAGEGGDMTAPTVNLKRPKDRTQAFFSRAVTSAANCRHNPRPLCR